MPPQTVLSFLVASVAIWPFFAIAHKSSAFRGASEFSCNEGYCQLLPSALRGNSGGACLPLTTRTTTMTITTFVSTTKFQTSSLEGQAMSSQLSGNTMISDPDPANDIEPQQDSQHTSPVASSQLMTTSELATQVGDDTTTSEMRSIGGFCLASTGFHQPLSSVTSGLIARPPFVSGTVPSFTATCVSNASYVYAGVTAGPSRSYIFTATPRQPSFQEAQSSLATGSKVDSVLVLVTALCSYMLA